jgi:hypothetical protein
MENQPRKLPRPRFNRPPVRHTPVIDAATFDSDPFSDLPPLFPNSRKLAPVVFTADDPDPFQYPAPAPHSPSAGFLSA